ncbi:hypothetical protein BC829DRAFT_64350 [Chytridium lagenaria]|nr:hypothetical protein BC829DRAFT_64350 [Chytridium lagenaria]
MPSSLAVTVAVPIVVIAILGSLVALVIVRRRRRKYMENHDTVSPPNGVPFIPHQGGTGSQRVNNVPSTHTQSKGIFMFPDAIPSSHEKTPPSIPVTMFEKKQPPLVHTRTTVYPPPTYSKEEEAKRQAMESTSSASTITSLVVPPREGSSSATVPHRDLRVSDVSQWTIGDVAEWLVGAGLGQLVGPFQEHCIDGDKFLMLSEEGLLGMGILNADMRAVVLFAVSRVRGDGREEPPEYS